VRDRSDVSPTSRASASISAGFSVNPQLRTASAAVAAVAPIAPAGALMAKYTPGVSAHAAISARTATNDSMTIPP
jgi:hypothetical protein